MNTYRPLMFTANIGQNAVRISEHEVATALSPNQLADPIVLELGNRISDDRSSSWEQALSEIRSVVAKAVQSPEPLAIFAIAPIPLLMALGNILGDKVSGVVFERHRHRADSEPSQAWCWEESGAELAWCPFQEPRFQRDVTDVSVLVSISGVVDPNAVAKILPQQHPQYEIRLEDPKVNVIRTRAQLASFVSRWREVFEHIRRHYGPSVRVHVFPAVPLSIAVESGRRLLQVDPTFRIYNATNREFRYALTIGAAGALREPESTVTG